MKKKLKILAGARVRTGLRAQDLADALGISPSLLSMVENHRRPLTVEFLEKVKEYVDFEGDEYKTLYKEARKKRSYKMKIASKILTTEILNDPNKINRLVKYAEQLSAQ